MRVVIHEDHWLDVDKTNANPGFWSDVLDSINGQGSNLFGNIKNTVENLPANSGIDNLSDLWLPLLVIVIVIGLYQFAREQWFSDV